VGSAGTIRRSLALLKSGKLLENPMNPKVPQMQKSNGADYQQGQALAYLFGVYFGDGYIPEGSHGFSVRAIDRDFVEYVRDQYLIWNPTAYTSINDDAQRGGFPGSKNMLYRFYGGNGELLRRDSHKRTEIPAVAHAHPKSFIEGLLDSDGFVSVMQDGSTIRFQVGIAKTNDIYHDVYTMIAQQGIKCQKMQTRKLPSGKILKRIRFNPESFLDSGLRFHIDRKQSRVDKYRAMLASFSFNDSKRTRKAMEESDLHSDMQLTS
jgi:hypothetical protein